MNQGSKHYFITFIDNYSKYYYAYFIHSKSKLFDMFKIYKIEVENQLEKKIKIFRYNRSGKYTFNFQIHMEAELVVLN